MREDFFTIPSELRETGTQRKQPKTREKHMKNEGRAENKQGRTRSSKPETDAQDQAGSRQTPTPTRHKQHSRQRQHDPQHTRRNRKQPPDTAPPLPRQRDPRNKKEMCRASKYKLHPLGSRCGPSALVVRAGQVLLALSLVVPCGS